MKPLRMREPVRRCDKHEVLFPSSIEEVACRVALQSNPPHDRLGAEVFCRGEAVDLLELASEKCVLQRRPRALACIAEAPRFADQSPADLDIRRERMARPCRADPR